MADVALVFRFGLAEMSGMTLAELAGWQERAKTVAEAMTGARGG